MFTLCLKVQNDINSRCIYLSEFLRQSLMIFTIQVFHAIVFVFIVVFTTFQSICPPVFFWCFLSNSRAYMELRNVLLFEYTGILNACTRLGVTKSEQANPVNWIKRMWYEMPCRFPNATRNTFYLFVCYIAVVISFRSEFQATLLLTWADVKYSLNG